MKKTLKQLVEEEYNKELKQVKIKDNEVKRRCNVKFFNMNHVPIVCGRRKDHPGYHLEANRDESKYFKVGLKKYYKVFTPLLTNKFKWSK